MGSRWGIVLSGHAKCVVRQEARTRRTSAKIAAVDTTVILYYCKYMKNITVSVDEDLYRRSRVWAAQAGSTVSALVRAFLVRLTEEDPEYDRLAERQDALMRQIRKDYPRFSAGDRLTRSAVHERDALR